jgi:hypothetical protein
LVLRSKEICETTPETERSDHPEIVREDSGGERSRGAARIVEREQNATPVFARGLGRSS